MSYPATARILKHEQHNPSLRLIEGGPQLGNEMENSKRVFELAHSRVMRGKMFRYDRVVAINIRYREHELRSNIVPERRGEIGPATS